MAHQGYGFCEFLTEEDAEYACKIMNQIKLWGKPIRVNKVNFRMLFRRSLLIHIVRRRHPTKSNSTWEQTSSLATSTKTWMSDCYTTPSVLLV